jgi:hypothetical protein
MNNFVATQIQRWWRKRTAMSGLKIVFNYLKQSLTPDHLQEIANKCYAISNACKGDGAGLAGGVLIDIFISQFFKLKLPEYTDCHTGEADMKMCKIPLSQKKINGPSTLALDWSKNKDKEEEVDDEDDDDDAPPPPPPTTKSSREHFSCPIMIINLKTVQWWKKSPRKPISHLNITYNDTMPAGIYLVDKQFCKFYIKLAKNNKTNTLIKKEFVYAMLKRSMALGFFISLPQPNKEAPSFNILNAFS